MPTYVEWRDRPLPWAGAGAHTMRVDGRFVVAAGGPHLLRHRPGRGPGCRGGTRRRCRGHRRDHRVGQDRHRRSSRHTAVPPSAAGPQPASARPTICARVGDARPDRRREVPERSAEDRACEASDRLDRVHEEPAFLDARVAFYRNFYDARTNPVAFQVIEHNCAPPSGASTAHQGRPARIQPRGSRPRRTGGDINHPASLLRTHLSDVCEQIINGLTD